jgi:hypothetical protein
MDGPPKGQRLEYRECYGDYDQENGRFTTDRSSPGTPDRLAASSGPSGMDKPSG